MDRSLRAYGVGAQILLDLGVRDMIVMSSTRPEPMALEGLWPAHRRLARHGWRDEGVSETPRILIVEARFYDALADALLEGAKETLKARGADFDVVTVPGALEIRPPSPWPRRPAGSRPHPDMMVMSPWARSSAARPIISKSCRIRSAAGIMALGVKGLAIGNGVLTTEDEDQAWYRARLSEGDKGGGGGESLPGPHCLKKRLRVGVGA